MLALGGGKAQGGKARAGADDQLQSGIRECANRARARHGLSKLREFKPLDQAASLHAHDMARRGYFSHYDPDGKGPSDRVHKFARRGAFDVIGENIAAGEGSPRGACSDWLDSSEHKMNILSGKFDFIGGGFAQGGPYGTYYVQVMAGR